MNVLHWLIDPIKYHYTNFEGRVGRQEFWMFVLFVYIVGITFEILRLDIFSLIWGFGTLLPHLALGARRLHDTGRSGWWQLLTFVPIVGWIILIIWFAEKTASADNMYGKPAEPKVLTSPTTSEVTPTPVATAATVISETSPVRDAEVVSTEKTDI